MRKSSLKRGKEPRDKEFATFGEYETVEKKKKVKDLIEREAPIERPIYYDRHQYSCKLPPEVMKTIGFKKGAKLRFTIIRKPLEGEAEVKIEYVRG